MYLNVNPEPTNKGSCCMYWRIVKSNGQQHQIKANISHMWTIIISCAVLLASVPVDSFITPGRQQISILPSSIPRKVTITKTKKKTVPLHEHPEGALSNYIIPSIFNLSDWKNDDDVAEDPRVWVPQTDFLSFRPLCFCTSQGYYVNLLKFKGGGVLGRHRHSSPVHGVTLKGSWRYNEHDWHACKVRG